MTRVYCTKCGIRGESKCPHCRSVFPNRMPLSNEYLEQMISVKPEYVKDWERDSTGNTPKLHSDGTAMIISHTVSVRSYQQNQDEALMDVVSRLQRVLADPSFNILVASCVHDWQIMPGFTSSIDCGHEGKDDAVVPVDPFAVECPATVGPGIQFQKTPVQPDPFEEEEEEEEEKEEGKVDISLFLPIDPALGTRIKNVTQVFDPVRGDIVSVMDVTGLNIVGFVDTATNYADMNGNDWYVEFYDNIVNRKGYHYCKQQTDHVQWIRFYRQNEGG